MRDLKNCKRPSYRDAYKIGDASRRFFSWVNMNIQLGGNKTPRMHYQIVDELVGCDDQFVEAIVHRGGAKSTVMSNFLPLYIADTGNLPHFGRVVNMIIFSDTVDQAIDQLRDIRDYWDNSDSLQERLTLARDKRGKIIADKVDYLALSNEEGHIIHIQAKGAGQSMRGTKKSGQRPQVLIFDDILNDNTLYSQLERKKLKTWFFSTVLSAVDITKYKMFIVGTPMTSDDLVMSLAASESVKTVMFPVAEEFPVPEEEVISSWKDRFTPQEIYRIFRLAQENEAEAEFYREMMLQVVNEDLRVFKDSYFKYFNVDKLNKEGMNFFTSLDISVSKKTRGDFVSIITIGVNQQGHWFIVRCDVGKYDPTQTLDILFEHVREFKSLDTRGEKAALQQVLAHFMEERMLNEQTFFQYNELERNSIDSKEFRISGLQPMMKKGMIHFPDDAGDAGVAELLMEMKGFTKEGATTAHDDAMDCLANFLDPGFVIKPMGGVTGFDMGGKDQKGSFKMPSSTLSDYYD
jgi:predicted phage terminase large subunit-like protein